MKEDRSKPRTGMNSWDWQGKPAGKTSIPSHCSTAPQSETATQEQTNQLYTSTQMQHTTSTPDHYDR